MTSANASFKNSKSRHTARALAYTYMTLFVTVLFFKNTSLTAEFVSSGLSLCAKKLVPSLFPFMVISSLIVKSGACSSLFSLLSRPLGFVFGISEGGTVALLLGWLCGFPVGAKCACDLFCEGKIEQEEYNTLLCISSTPSPAFLVGTVGTGMLGDTGVGIALYAASLFSSVVIGIFLKIIHRESHPRALQRLGRAPTLGFARILTKSVSESALGMLNVCAFVVFFSAFLGTLNGVIAPLGLSDKLTSLLFGFFEISMGSECVCALARADALPLIALVCGWSGISVHLQTVAICHAGKCKFGSYIISHAAKALICCLIFIFLF